MQTLEWKNLALMLVPFVLVLAVLWHWQMPLKSALVALLRMLLQLVAVGYVLAVVFGLESAYWVLAVMLLMLLASAWIALSAVSTGLSDMHQDSSLIRQYYWRWALYALLAIGLGGGLTLLVAVMGVMQVQPWYQPNVLIPLAGMAFANAMTTVSLVAERYVAELPRQADVKTARNIAFQAAMIPSINALMAVGLVSLPGMMTGQILSGVDPLIAVRYQIMVMLMIFSASGLAAFVWLRLAQRDGIKKPQSLT